MLFDIPVRLGEDGFIGSSQIENPLRAGLLGGTIIGGIQGFLTGLVIGISDTDSLPKGALAGFIVAECLIFGIYFFISVFSNPNFLYLILDLIKNNLSALLKISLTLIIPSAMTGLILAKIISSISHSQS